MPDEKPWRKFFYLEHQRKDLGMTPDHKKSDIIAIKRRENTSTAQRIAVTDGDLDKAFEEAEGIAQAMYEDEEGYEKT